MTAFTRPTNYGFIPPRIEDSDFWLGSKKLGSVVLNEKGDWWDFLPEFELQRKDIETNACVSFATLSALEMLYRFHYVDDPNYSDRFLAKISNTSPEAGGNTPKAVSEALRKNGCVPETEWPFAEPLSEYYKEIPQRIKDMGLDWLKNNSWGYEWVNKEKLKEGLKRSPLGCAVYAWSQNEKGEYIRLGASNHYVVLVAFDEFDRPVIWDSYDKGLKTLEKGYEFEFPQLYTLKKKEPQKKEYDSRGFYGKILMFFRHFFFWR